MTKLEILAENGLQSVEDKFISITNLIPLIQEWGAKKGLHNTHESFSDLSPQMLKLVEELGEAAAGIARQDHEKIIDSIGDMLVVLIQFGAIHDKMLGIDRKISYTESYLEMCLNAAWVEIKERKGKTVDSVFVKDS